MLCKTFPDQNSIIQNIKLTLYRTEEHYGKLLKGRIDPSTSNRVNSRNENRFYELLEHLRKQLAESFSRAIPIDKNLENQINDLIVTIKTFSKQYPLDQRSLEIELSLDDICEILKMEETMENLGIRMPHRQPESSLGIILDKGLEIVDTIFKAYPNRNQ